MQQPITIDARPGSHSLEVSPTDLPGVEIYRFPWISEMRGDLTVGELGQANFPFQPKRYFIVFGVPPDISRGEHAHKRCHQFLICVQGRCNAMVDDGTTRREFILDNPSVGLYLPPMIWGTQHSYSDNAALLVFASEAYDPDDYIRDYDAFRSAVRAEAR